MTYVALGATVVDLIVEIQLFRSANKVVTMADELGDLVTLDESVIDKIRLVAPLSELEGLMVTKLNGLPLAENNITASFVAFSNERKLDFFNDFYGRDDNDIVWPLLNRQFSYEINGVEYEKGFIDIWRDDITDRALAKDEKFLLEYSRIVYQQPEISIHLTELTNSPRFGGTGFNPIGGHTSKSFLKINSLSELSALNSGELKFLIIDPNIPGLPQNFLAIHIAKVPYRADT